MSLIKISLVRVHLCLALIPLVPFRHSVRISLTWTVVVSAADFDDDCLVLPHSHKNDDALLA